MVQERLPDSAPKSRHLGKRYVDENCPQTVGEKNKNDETTAGQGDGVSGMVWVRHALPKLTGLKTDRLWK